MAVIVEDGTLVITANSFVTVAEWDAYWEARNRSDMVDLDDEPKEAAILFSSSTLAWGWSWRGQLVNTRTQNFPFPRYGLTDDDGRFYSFPNSVSAEGQAIPTRLKEATFELGAAHVAEALNEILSRGGEIKKEAVGPLVTEYFESANPEREYPYVERMIAGLHDGPVAARGGNVSQHIGLA